ncbi:MAG: hypothetical protein HWD60_10680 [Defluviicoccus sp.]|nr:MAG: hypothetical protein HWD60_10680 [Defluviicoccus sp.]
MADPIVQHRWRRKHRFVKRQLNVMARTQTHAALAQFAERFCLRGKGEAVAFACFVTRALIQRADYSPEAAQMLDDLALGYHRDRSALGLRASVASAQCLLPIPLPGP